MKISTKARYALRLMISVAMKRESKITLKTISEEQNISLKYLEQIVNPLVKKGILVSIRGSQGGYTLSRKPCEYTAGEIIRVFEGNLSPIPCLEPNAITCGKINKCQTVKFWKGLEDVINNYVDSVTIEDLTLNLGCEQGNQIMGLYI